MADHNGNNNGSNGGNNSFKNTVESLFKGMDSFLTTKTVIGEAIHIGDNILLPLADVSFGIAAGAFTNNTKNNGGGGMGAKITPSAILVINKNGTRVVNVRSQDAVSKIMDMIPDLVAKFTNKDKDTCTEEELEHILHQEEEKSEQ